MQELLRLHNSQFIKMKVYNDRYLVKGLHDAYHKFEAIKIIDNKPEKLKITFSNNETVTCSTEHRFFFSNMEEVFASELCVGQSVMSKNGKTVSVSNIEYLFNDEKLYDLVNVDNIHSAYYTNDILSHNCFTGSTYTLIKPDVLTSLKKQTEENKKKIKPKKIVIGNDFEVTIYHVPDVHNMYMISCDVADGVGKDWTVVNVFDITANGHIREVAYFASNRISPHQAAFVLCYLGKLYFNAPIVVECNNMGKCVTDFLQLVYEYENVPCVQGKNNRAGVYSTNGVKMDACLFVASLLAHPQFKIDLYTERIVKELHSFVKIDNPRKKDSQPTYRGIDGSPDDHCMAFIWNLYMLKEDNLSYVYDCNFKEIDGLHFKFYFDLKRFGNEAEYDFRTEEYKIRNKYKEIEQKRYAPTTEEMMSTSYNNNSQEDFSSSEGYVFGF